MTIVLEKLFPTLLAKRENTETRFGLTIKFFIFYLEANRNKDPIHVKIYTRHTLKVYTPYIAEWIHLPYDYKSDKWSTIYMINNSVREQSDIFRSVNRLNYCLTKSTMILLSFTITTLTILTIAVSIVPRKIIEYLLFNSLFTFPYGKMGPGVTIWSSLSALLKVYVIEKKWL